MSDTPDQVAAAAPTTNPIHERLKLLRKEFPKTAVGKLPRAKDKNDTQKGHCNECGGYHVINAVHLDYVGHAAVTEMLLNVDPEWTWEPLALDQHGLPAFDARGGLWIKLTICGVTRLGYGDDSNGKGAKELIGDALRNAAMRFGVALPLWSKQDLYDIQGVVEETATDGTVTRRAIPNEEKNPGKGHAAPAAASPAPTPATRTTAGDSSTPVATAAAEADHVKNCTEINGRLSKFNEVFALGIWRAAESWPEREHMLTTALDWVNATIKKLGTKGKSTAQDLAAAAMAKNGWADGVRKDSKGMWPKTGFPTKPQVVEALRSLLGPATQAGAA